MLPFYCEEGEKNQQASARLAQWKKFVLDPKTGEWSDSVHPKPQLLYYNYSEGG